MPLAYPSRNVTSGVGIHVQAMARELQMEGHQVTIIALKGKGEAQDTWDDGVRVVWVSPSNLHWYISKIPLLKVLMSPVHETELAIAVQRKLKQLSAEQAFDLIQLTEVGGFLVCLQKSKMRCPVVLSLHGEKYTIYKRRPDLSPGIGMYLGRKLQQIAIKKADHLISPSLSHADTIREELKRNFQIAVLPNYIDFDEIAAEFEPPASMVKLRPSKIVLYVGRIERGKGVEPLVKCIPEVVRQYPDVKFVFIGNRHPSLPSDALNTLIAEYGVENHLQILDPVERDEIFAYLHFASIVAMPSYYETFGFTFVEGMAMKKPVVGFGGSSLEEIVGDRENGIVVRLGDIQALAENILRLLQDEEQAENMGVNGYNRVKENFSKEVVLPKFMDFYRTISNRQESKGF
ncbi:MAG: glycosyltransferase family 4 protein [Anaerolineae bacterium]|nr:glycosyltransferase family 4 protein [Anaerolineae bacterium]